MKLKRSKKSTKVSGNDEYNPEKHNSSLVKIGWITVSINFILALFTYWLFSVSVEQSKMAAKSLDRTDTAIAITKRNFVIENRAFIVEEDISNMVFHVGKKFYIEFNYKNIGKTPANIIRIILVLSILPIFVEFTIHTLKPISIVVITRLIKN